MRCPLNGGRANVRQLNADGRTADVEVIEYLVPDVSQREVLGMSELSRVEQEGRVIDDAAVIVHPFEDRDLEAIRSVVAAGLIERLFVMVWSPDDRIRTWLDSAGAVNLHTGVAMSAPDLLMVAAAEIFVYHQYNGLSSGPGKDAVVQIVRAFAAEGYPIDVDPWLRAYFAAGGTFRHAESIARLIKEMATGVKHRVTPRYGTNIVATLRDQIVDPDDRTAPASPSW
ncbi:hypothetical protein DXT87_17435 [Arthrobacter sp. AET 35A]|nr:hypothetical protein [Arthrobacter sp. AET 35A]